MGHECAGTGVMETLPLAGQDFIPHRLTRAKGLLGTAEVEVAGGKSSGNQNSRIQAHRSAVLSTRIRD